MKDEQIISLYFARSQEAIRETESKYGKYCHAIAYYILSSHEDADECVNDTWLAAWENMPPQKPSVLSSFLGRLTRNKAIDRLSLRLAKKRSGHILPLMEELAETLPDAMNEDVLLDEIVMKDALNRFLYALPDTERNIFLQRYWYCRAVKEIAQEFSLEENRVSVILYRCRKALKAYLEACGLGV